jgi:hypothetical protein
MKTVGTPLESSGLPPPPEPLPSYLFSPRTDRRLNRRPTDNPAGGRKTAELFGGPKEALTIGKAFGHKSHYG